MRAAPPAPGPTVWHSGRSTATTGWTGVNWLTWTIERPL